MENMASKVSVMNHNNMKDIVKIQCAECGKEYDETNDKCPYCGCPLTVSKFLAGVEGIELNEEEKGRLSFILAERKRVENAKAYIEANKEEYLKGADNFKEVLTDIPKEDMYNLTAGDYYQGNYSCADLAGFLQGGWDDYAYGKKVFFFNNKYVVVKNTGERVNKKDVIEYGYFRVTGEKLPVGEIMLYPLSPAREAYKFTLYTGNYGIDAMARNNEDTKGCFRTWNEFDIKAAYDFSKSFDAPDDRVRERDDSIKEHRKQRSEDERKLVKFGVAAILIVLAIILVIVCR